MAGTYNINTYNSALYNAGRDEVGAIARSIIQAHTGPHIQAVVGSDPRLPANQSGISFISDFNIIEGTVRPPPTSFFFPDLRARLNVIQIGQEDLNTLLQAIQKFDMPAGVFPVAFLPDLGAILFGLVEEDLPAFIFGKLAELDLGARLQIVQEDLSGRILGIEAPNLPGTILGISSPILNAIIWAPLDLPAFLNPVSFDDLSGSIRGFQFKDVSGNILGIAAPNLAARIKGFSAAQKNLPSSMTARLEEVLPAIITASIPGPNDVTGIVENITGGFTNLPGFIRRVDSDAQNLLATIGKAISQNFDLVAKIDFLSALNLGGDLKVLPLGEFDKFLPALLQPVNPFDISASIESNQNLKNLSASIVSSFGTANLSGFIRVAETFVTAILTVSTYSTANLKSTIGNPTCAGGSASVLLSAIATAQQANDLSGFIQSFFEKDLGASINQKEIFHVLDTIDICFSPKRVRDVKFLTTDTIDVLFSPFQGLNLGAFIQSVLSNIDLSATITAQIPLPRVEPAINRITAAEIRPDRAFDIQEIRIQMEGQLLNYFYVNGTQDAFIQDANEQWRINVRGFRPIADGLFGEFASARICRLGRLENFNTLDAAMRACLAAVIGQEGENDLSAFVKGTGSINNLIANLSVSDVFDNLGAKLGTVFPIDLLATINGTDLGKKQLNALITPVVVDALNIPANIVGFGEEDLTSTITGIP